MTLFRRLLTLAALTGLGTIAPVAAAEPTSRNDPRLKQLLERFAEADANDDGVLTETEARVYLKALRSGEASPAGAKRKRAAADADDAQSLPTRMVPMRDGVRLATDVYLPAGDGPWPAIAQRTPYGRKGARQPDLAAGFVGRGYAFVIQDWRGQFDSEGKFDRLGPKINQDDGYDTVEWIASQPWCNGKVGIMGGSGPGIAALQAVVANPPHLVAAVVSVASAFPEERQAQTGGVLQTHTAQWLAKRGVAFDEWPRPSTWLVDRAIVPAAQGGASARGKPAPNHVALLHRGGWFDIFGDAPLTQFSLQDKSRSRAIMAPSGHSGRTTDLPFPNQRTGETAQADWFDYWLKGQRNRVLDGPAISYYLMGDARRPGAPGNVWRQAETWPVPNEPTPYYLREDGALTLTPPAETEATKSYNYTPREPVPTLGGAIMGSAQGPADQRPLTPRSDILRFATAALDSPVEITGSVRAELWISSDAPDTTFMVKLIDIYPDGYEALLLDSAAMARYRDGFDKPAPQAPGRASKLTIELGSTAQVFDRGHRIGVHVASSNAPKFEVHPNTFVPVASYDAARVARNAVHVSSAHPSKLIVPRIAANQKGNP